MSISSRPLSTSESFNERLNKIFKDTQALLLHPDYLVVNKDNQPIKANSSLVEMRAKLTPLISACEEDLASEKKIISIPKTKALLQGVMKITQATYSDAVQINFRKKLAEIISGLSNENNDSKENSNAEKTSKWIGGHQPKVLPLSWRTAATAFSKNKDQKSLEELISALEKVDKNKSNLNQSPVQLPQLGELLASGLRQSQQNEKNAQMQALEIFLLNVALERSTQQNEEHALESKVNTKAAELVTSRMSILGSMPSKVDEKKNGVTQLNGQPPRPSSASTSRPSMMWQQASKSPSVEDTLLEKLKVIRNEESAILRAKVMGELVNFCKNRHDETSIAAANDDESAKQTILSDKIICGRLVLECITGAESIHTKIDEVSGAVSAVLKSKLDTISNIHLFDSSTHAPKEVDSSVRFVIKQEAESTESFLKQQKTALGALYDIKAILYGAKKSVDKKADYLPEEFLTGSYKNSSNTPIAEKMDAIYNEAYAQYTAKKPVSRPSVLPTR